MKTNPILKTLSLSLSCVGFLMIANSSNLFADFGRPVEGGGGKNKGGGCPTIEVCGASTLGELKYDSTDLDVIIDQYLERDRNSENFQECLGDDIPAPALRPEGHIYTCEEKVELGDFRVERELIVVQQNLETKSLKITLIGGNEKLDQGGSNLDECSCPTKRKDVLAFSYEFSAVTTDVTVEGSSSPFKHVTAQSAQAKKLTSTSSVVKIGNSCQELKETYSESTIDFKEPAGGDLNAAIEFARSNIVKTQNAVYPVSIPQPSHKFFARETQTAVVTHKDKDQCDIPAVERQICTNTKTRDVELDELSNKYVFPLNDWEDDAACAKNSRLPTFDPEQLKVDKLSLTEKNKEDGSFIGRLRYWFTR